jgi:exosortase
MVPLPLLVISQVTLQMKFFVATVATSWIQATGIPAIREGSYIHMPNAVMLVGDPCSGLRSFLAILCLGFFLAYDMKSSLRQKIAFIICGWPIAILANICRVYFLGLVADIYGAEYSREGSLPHDASGYLVFVIAFFLLLWIRRKMEAMHVRQTA